MPGDMGTQKSLRTISWEEVQKHNTAKDAWLVIDNGVYDITKWSWHHPGGRVILNYAGQDGTDAYVAFHPDLEYARKFMTPYLIGEVVDAPEPSPLLKDFRNLRSELYQSGYFKANYWFYLWNVLHIMGLEALAVLTFYYFGTGWMPYLAAAMMLVTAQSQAGWLQHDFGHLSVFKGYKRGSWYDHTVHHIVIGTLKGASSNWWNWRHYNHHAKPNVLQKDYDIAFPYLFVLGDESTKQWAEARRGFMPYRLQHRYWFLTMPPLLLPVYFHMENLHYCIKKREWRDLLSLGSYYLRFFFLFSPFLGVAGTMKFYFFFRFVESHWFTWVTQMNHIPMKVEKDNQREWPVLQNQSTCNIEGGHFNDWFTGHLNYQVEHHLFPTMPRHQYKAVHPMVQALFQKHGQKVSVKPIITAAADIVHCLEKYGNMWHDAYYQK